MEAPALPDGLEEALKRVGRQGMYLRWNPRSVITEKGYFEADGTTTEPEYEPRFELWDVTDEGLEYMVKRIQHADGSFLKPDFWLVEFIAKINPGNYANPVDVLLAMADEPNLLRENVAQSEARDLQMQIGKWAEWLMKPKVGPATQHRHFGHRSGDDVTGPMMTFPESELTGHHVPRGSGQIVLPGSAEFAAAFE